MKNKKYTGIQKVGLGMVIVSCVLFALLPFNVCLPLSACVITGITAVMWGSSEILFYAGGALLGKSLMDALKEKISFKHIICKKGKKS
ncbi:transporter suffix domain-containing protein [Roseburia sp. 499]|uniref:transporter suffix domain-containing protein n=1 Tax=Roseburia sp. 499 TaxID=1261634 RepID=UPI000952AA91|nr:transporter suffix domain-containing protein [Roseburia sp. 499]WVK69373.1 transporter suffix domain-containing protein [Roseburia sp. 499]